MVVGIGSAFGEVSHFGYLKNLPSEYVGPFCSGTGICGLTGSFMYLLLHSLNVKDYIIFFWLIPIAALYLTNFIILNKISSKNYFFHVHSLKEHGLIEYEVSYLYILFLFLFLFLEWSQT